MDKNNHNSSKKPLTKLDALEKMCSDIRKFAEVTRYGKLWYPTKRNPSIICTVHNGMITELDILFLNSKHDPDGIPIVPDRSVHHKSD